MPTEFGSVAGAPNPDTNVATRGRPPEPGMQLQHLDAMRERATPSRPRPQTSRLQGSRVLEMQTRVMNATGTPAIAPNARTGPLHGSLVDPEAIPAALNDPTVRCHAWELGCSTFSGLVFLPYSIIVLSIVQIVFFYALPDSVAQFGLVTNVDHADWANLFLCAFGHTTASHLWANMGLQLTFGVVVEMSQGTLRTQTVYWTSGIVAAALDVAMFQPRSQRHIIRRCASPPLNPQISVPPCVPHACPHAHPALQRARTER